MIDPVDSVDPVDLVDEKYVDFVRRFSVSDPEPEMKLSEMDLYVQHNPKGREINHGYHYPWDQVVRHIEWLHRFHSAYSRWQKP